MCLTVEQLGMRFWKEEDCYVGTGYKILGESDEFKTGEWVEANGYWGTRAYIEENIKERGMGKDYDYENKSYVAGFHIFLKEEDAVNYDRSSFNEGCSNVYKVDYTEVVGFGQQRAGGKEVPCVISRWMYIHPVPVLSEKDNN